MPVSTNENIEGVPDLEVTLEKILDSYPLMYHVASAAVEHIGNTTDAAVEVQMSGRTIAKIILQK